MKQHWRNLPGRNESNLEEQPFIIVPSVLNGERLCAITYQSYAPEWGYAYELLKTGLAYECRVMIAAKDEKMLRRVERDALSDLLLQTDQAMDDHTPWSPVAPRLPLSVVRRKTVIFGEDIGAAVSQLILQLPRVGPTKIAAFYEPMHVGYSDENHTRIN